VAVATDSQVTSLQRRLTHTLSRVPLPHGGASRLFFEIIVIGAGWFLYQFVRGLVEGGRVDTAFSNADSLIAVERSLGIFWEVQLQSLIVGNLFLINLFNWVYIWGYLPVIGAIAIWLYLFRRGNFARYRNAFLISGAMGLVIFALLPMAPPRFLPDAGFVDTVGLHAEIYKSMQNPALVNQYAAMPSLHLGWMLLIGLAVFETAKVIWARTLGLFMPVPMLASIILTGNHFILDAVAGVAVALVALWLANRLNRWFAGTRIHAVLV
jgi:hypothetical protein